MTDGLSDATAIGTASPNALSAGRDGALHELGGLVQKLAASLAKLETAAVALQLPALAGREWFDLLQRKLLPQLQDGAYLIVAVVGGTNIGKSVVFNHIAGFRASASSPLASGTKHPVCLVPERFTETHDLHTLFPSFELRPWAGGNEALQSTAENCLFWRSHEQVPENLVILDTPDVDSDAPINWQRADAVRQAADVLVAVLTQQKYNDAAVKQFFRKAATEDKAAIIVFNQVELPDDEEYWPVWLNTFCSETGLKPEYVYLAPNNRKAAEAIALEFEEREWRGTTGPQLTQRGKLSEVLSQLRFAEIKLRTLRGSLLFVIDSQNGAPAYLDQIRSLGQQFRDAAGIFLRRSMVQNADWPTPPNSLIINEMWSWWRNHREAWTAGIHGFYGRIGGAVRTGWQAVRTRLGHASAEPIADYRQQEWAAIVRVLQQLYEQLHIITTLNNPLLTARLNHLLSGTSCEALLSRLQQEHDRFDFAGLIHELVSTEMEWLRTERQPLFDLLRKVDGATAVFRPVFTVGFALSGGVGAEHFLVNAATHTLTHMAVDASAVAATTVAGEAAVDAATGLLGQAKASLLRLQGKFTQRREVWLLDQLKQHLLGGLLTELEAGATVSDSPAFHEVAGILQDLTRRMGEIES